MYQLWRATLALTVDVVTLVTVAMVTLLLVSKRCMCMSVVAAPDGVFTYRNHGDRALVQLLGHVGHVTFQKRQP
jgi:hypothetical protein